MKKCNQCNNVLLNSFFEEKRQYEICENCQKKCDKIEDERVNLAYDLENKQRLLQEKIEEYHKKEHFEYFESKMNLKPIKAKSKK